MPNALPDTAVKRFQDDLRHLTAGREGLHFGLCVSGGPDSIALLLLATATGFACEAATVDHGLRPEAAEEARFVSQLCGELSIPHSILTLDGPAKGNVSAWARRERYAALLGWLTSRKLDVLLTAHHADDQLETMIMRLNRGSGLAGLAAIRGQRDGLLRPLLGWRKTELEALVARAGIAAVDDPSNRDDRYDRARLRKALACADWLDPISAARSAAALSEAEDALEWAAAAYFNRRVAEQGGIISFDPRGLPRELLRRITLLCLRKIDPAAHPRGDELDRLIQGLASNRIATLAGVKCGGGSFWLFERAPERAKT